MSRVSAPVASMLRFQPGNQEYEQKKKETEAEIEKLQAELQRLQKDKAVMLDKQNQRSALLNLHRHEAAEIQC
jgi:hypothetical protein